MKLETFVLIKRCLGAGVVLAVFVLALVLSVGGYILLWDLYTGLVGK